MTRWIAIDAGQTTVRARTSWLPGVLTADGFRDLADAPVAAALGAVRPILAEFGLVEQPLVVAIGHTGLPESTTELEELAELVAESLGEDPVGASDSMIDVRLFPDSVTAHAGALSGRPGVVLAAGTGAVCLGVDQDGRSVRADGVGHWIGDEGSAFDLGRSGLRLAARHDDGREPAPALHEAARHYLLDELALAGEFGPALRRLCWVPDRVRLTAAFARQVIDCHRAGDQSAGRLLDRAGAALAETVSACCARIDPPPAERRIACVGGMFTAGDDLLRPLSAALDLPDWQLVPAAGTVLDGVVRLAQETNGIHSSLGHLRKGPR
ncbi:N-acetylglucosamine kinase [Microlunatus speluncae]|uniref:N-acetylglucosamine kinase n=1 Tax=Microlunatus speluncae TaxID=2594267 RepID=UPI0012663C9E|nr:BadF/BadG/BcrA/BcrD ATPase family protein [Microlunatus speluncae]